MTLATELLSSLRGSRPALRRAGHALAACGLALSASACGGASSNGMPVGDGGTVQDGSTMGMTETLTTSGRHIVDRCGNGFVPRGLENALGEQLPPGNDWGGFVDKMAATGANAIRILPDVAQLSLSDLDKVFQRVVANDLVVYVSPGDRSWFGQSGVKTLLDTYKGHLILDAFQEPNYDDRTRWLSDVEAAIDQVRGYGYTVPITVLANQYGRDLPVLLSKGADVVAHDPQHRVILGWQAYWGSSGWYQSQYHMTLSEGFAAAAAAAFPIQAGIDDIADLPNEHMDYSAAMTAAQSNGIGWLWWDWYNPYGSANSLSTDGTVNHLTSVGTTVVNTHPASIAHTSVKACRPM